MSRQVPFLGVAITVVLAALTGCQPQQPFYFKQVDGDLAHYKGVATEIEYPDVDADRLGDVDGAKRPFSLSNNDPKDIWDLTLEEAMRIALTNNKVMRNIGGQVQGSPDFLLRNPEVAPTIYDPALAESNPRTGTEAALSAFDAQFSTSLMWQKLDTPQNQNPAYNSIFPNVIQDDLGTFQAKLSKVTATGGTFAMTHNVAYDLSNKPSREYTSDWNVNLVAEMRQPLLQGAGVQFNRIAGPGATPGLYNGVVIARINTDIALADFENSVRNLVSDVEVAYWELYFQYRSLDAVIAGRDSALSTWRKIYTLYRIGGKGGEAEKEAQAREQYYLFRSTAEQSLNALYSTEAKLRYLLGLAATDGRLIRPKDEPTTAKVVFDWYEVLNEGLARNVELREEKWIVKRRELELIAAKNFLLPKLDLVAQYRWLGLGNNLLPEPGNTGGGDFSLAGSNAYQSMTSGDFQEWQFGLQMNLPLGFRREMAGVRNAQLQLAKERTKLQEGELELSHQLSFAIRQSEAEHVLSQTQFNRRIAAQREVEAVAAAYETDTITLDVLLKAQQNLAQAESDYFRMLVDYNKSIAQVHYRKGSLLEYNGVYLAEGPWPAKAYFDARRRSRAREASVYLDYGFTQPRVISRGPVEQCPSEEGAVFESGQSDAAPAMEPTPAQPELVPTPEPKSIQSGAAPAEPEAPKPAAEPQAAKRGTVPLCRNGPEGASHKGGLSPFPQPASASQSGKNHSGWTVVAKMPAASNRTDVGAAVALPPQGRQYNYRPNEDEYRPIEDEQVKAAGWTVAEKGSNHEPATNPASAPVDWSASGWKGIQH